MTIHRVFVFLATASLVAACGPADNSNKANTAAIDAWEDCLAFNTAAVQAQFVSGDWKVVEGSHWMFSFGSNSAAARRTAEIIRTYRLAHSCFVGRPGPSMQYQLTAGGTAAVGNLLSGEDCIAFNNATVEAKWFPNLNTWKIVDGNMWMLDFGINQAEAFQALRVIKKHGFNRQCFVARPNPPFAYWKRA